MVVPSHFVPLAAPGAVSTALKWMWNPESPLYIKPRLDWDLMSWGWKFMRAANARHVERSAPLIRDLSFASRDCFEELAALPDNDFGLVKKGLVMLCKTQESLDHEAAFAKQANQLGVPAEVLDGGAWRNWIRISPWMWRGACISRRTAISRRIASWRG